MTEKITTDKLVHNTCSKWKFWVDQYDIILKMKINLAESLREIVVWKICKIENSPSLVCK